MIEAIIIAIVCECIIAYLFIKHAREKKALAPIIAQGDVAGDKWLAYMQWCTDNNIALGSAASQVYWTTH